ncbi:MAG: metallophosphoesterase family protein [Eubacterium sp.]|jgi:putative phosphoesterase|nr:metallophosphoesterase family protein [Eubacterium sp.]
MIGIISDIHGNFPALTAVLKKLDAAGCDRIISLGDVSGYYCMVNECIAELRERNIVNIMGNHDYYIMYNKKCERSYTVNICLDYQRQILTETNLEWLRQSVSNIRENGTWYVHGGWHDYTDEYVTDFSFLDKENGEIKIYVSGHTHIQKRVDGTCGVYFNPGSVGQPRDHIPTAAYAVMDDNGKIDLKRTEYDIDRIAYEMERAGFQERVASCLYSGVKIGEDGK